MRQAGQIVAEVLAGMRESVAPGMTTADLEAVAAGIIVDKHGAIPSSKGIAASRG